MTRPAERPARGLWRTEVVRAVLSGHSILGISFAAAIYLVCLSGTLSVFMRDFQRWEQPAAPVVTATSDRAVGDAVAAFGKRAGGEHPLYVLLPSADFSRLVLSTGDVPGGETWIADASGRLTVQQAAPWTDFISELHAHLHLPEAWGKFIVGLTGVALLSSLISGVLAHPRVFRDAFHLRLGGSRRLEQADLHNRLGVWPLPFHVIVTLTGALLGLSTIIVGVLALLLFRGDTEKVYGLLSPPHPPADARPAPMPDLAALLAQARARAPGAEPRQLTVENWGRRDMHVALTAGRPQLIAQQDSFVFDAAGRITAEQHPATQTVGSRILGSLGPLHFGWFGGAGVRIAYGLLGLTLCVVTSSGISVWLARRRDKGRAAPHWERVWAAISWGQPLALAIPALVAIARPPEAGDAGMLVAIWLTLTIGLIAGAAAMATDAAKLARRARLATGATLLATALLYPVTRGWPVHSPTALAILAAVAAGGLVLTGVPRRPAERKLTDLG